MHDAPRLRRRRWRSPPRPRRATAAGPPRARSQLKQLELATDGIVRHLRPGRRSARLPGLPRGLLGLPLAEFVAYRNLAALGYTDDQIKAIAAEYHGPRRAERRGRDVRPPRPAVRPFHRPVPQRAGGRGRQWRQGAAGPVADRQGARGRPRLHLQHPHRLRGAAGRRQGAGWRPLQRLFPRPRHRHAAAAERRTR